MPFQPTLKSTQTERQYTDEFAGYNHNLRIKENEFYDMQNMTSDYYPILSPRAGRRVYAENINPKGLIAKDNLCYVDGKDFVIDKYHIDMGLNDEPKNLVSMGAYVLIFPDKKYINTLNLTDFGNIEAEWQSAGAVTFSLCTVDGAEYTDTVVSATAPTSPANGAYWIDTSGTPHALKQYAASSESWVTIATTYIKISAEGIGRAFKQWDGVTIEGVSDEKLQALNSTMVIQAIADDYIVVIGIIDTMTEQDEPLTVSRKIPAMDFVIESENRLWGCRYGTNNKGEVVNEIYACKLGDFKNWNSFMGISTDSYAASCGTDGQFTGAITHLGYPLFFKENCVHKVYGNMPSNYQIQTTAMRGVQKDSGKSLAIVNELLFYKASSGICVYDGSLPVEISAVFGQERYSEAVGGAFDNKYYVSMKGTDGSWNLFVYDQHKAMWHREDNLRADCFACARDVLYVIEHGTGEIIELAGCDSIEQVDWSVETGDLGLGDPNMKYISRLAVRLNLSVGARVDFDAIYDNNRKWKHVATLEGTSLRTFTFPLRTKRCDHIKLRIKGKGEAKIYSIEKIVERGSYGGNRYRH